MMGKSGSQRVLVPIQLPCNSFRNAGNDIQRPDIWVLLDYPFISPYGGIYTDFDFVDDIPVRLVHGYGYASVVPEQRQ
jgi:hypothetical protein